MTHPTTQDPQDQKPTTSLSSEQPELILETISCESPSRNLQDQLDHSKTDQQSVDPSKPLSTEQPSQRQTRTRTQSYLDAVRHEQGFLDDNLPPRSATVVASSSQHILATALRRDISSNDSLSLNAITIAFSILPIRNRDTPSWLFTLPSPSIPPMKHRPAHRKSHQPMCPAAVDHMLFSPDGTHLVICSHTSSAHDGLGHLRLSILIQASSRADEWRLAWDEVVCDFSVRSVHDSSPLEPHTKRVLSARFIAQPRRWHTEPMSSETKLPADQVSMIKGTRYHKMKKPRGSAINYYAQGKGQTVAMVLNTNELFVVHLPLPQSNLPPHVLLTSLSNSTLPTSPLKLTPTPASVRVDRKRTITHDSECPSQGPQPESVVSQIIQKVNESIPKKIGLGLSVQSTPFPLMDETNPSLHPSYAAPQNLNIDRSLTPLFANTTPVQNGLETANPNGELVYDFNANNYSQFDLSMNSFISARKEIKTATIGFPIASKDAEDKFEEPRFLIAFQSKIKPIIPTPIKQIVLPASSSDFKSQLEDANQIGGSQFSITEDDLGNYITGLGDLDDAFDTPLDQAYPNTTQNSTSDNRKEIHEISMGEDGKTEESISIGRKRKRRQELLELQKKRRRYEPIAGIDESGAKDGTGDQASYGLIELAEVFVDFEDGMIPTIAIQPLSSIPVLDPFEHNGDCRITIRNLNFLELEHISSLSETTGHPAIRLLATYSRETIFGQGTDDNATIDELQCWEAYYERSCLSNGFLSLECFSENQRADKANLDQLTGPEEWVREGFYYGCLSI
ncbi:hypothetical protein BY996DRAFT_4586440 [Phakopsora pachyrhizi]|uniref:Uncharacterized protein n=1 Tax=Phakopsora pachyrhizi TaxID=170000 RepID=A0AAV0AJD0_PHAPC|nr:hypothetical protein BY996DRAFT_4586440 [Phakopsora pachyrhizi]CAH7668111.1 hypothetical protein PPACK8108_LOCUS2588 [Phakopsora pachyrhizi]